MMTKEELEKIFQKINVVIMYIYPLINDEFDIETIHQFYYSLSNYGFQLKYVYYINNNEVVEIYER